MEKVMWTRKRRILAGGCAAALLFAGFFSGMGLRRLLPAGGEAVPVYSVEGLRDKKWSDAVSLPATVEAGSLTSYYYDSRKPAVELYVTEGQRVEAGMPLLRYDCAALAEELSGVERSLENQRIYLGRLGSFIGTLKATKPIAESPAGFRPVSFQGTAPVSAEESLEGFLETEGRDGAPVVYDRVDGSAVPSGGSGTAPDPYIYYVKKGGEVAPEVLALLARMKSCARFLVVEDEGSTQTPLLVWTFDGKLYEDMIQGELPSESASEAESSPESSPGTETSSEPLPETEPAPESSSETESSEESSPSQDSVPETSGTDQTEESTSGQGTDFEGPFDDGALDEALGGLESAPQGYTKEELARAIRERSLEYENLELAIRKKELQAENLKQEMEENVLTAEASGLVRTAADPREAARLGQPVLTVQSGDGNSLSGQMNEVLAGVLKPGDRLTVSARVREKEVSFEAVLQSVEKETGGYGTEGYVSGGGGDHSGLPDGDSLLSPAGDETGNPAMSYYRFTASLAETKGIRAGDAVEILIPRTMLGKTGAEGGDLVLEGGIVLPDSLLFYEGGSAFVYAMDEDGCLVKRPVETGRSFGGTETEILSGLTGEDYLAYPDDAAGMEGAKARIVYGEEMEIGTEESEEWEEREP